MMSAAAFQNTIENPMNTFLLKTQKPDIHRMDTVGLRHNVVRRYFDNIGVK